MKRASLPAVVLFMTAVFLSAACGRFHVRTQLQNGIWAAENDLWDEAVFRWKKALAANPASAAAHNNLAVAYEKKGMWEDARKEYAVALQLDPQNDRIKFNNDQFQLAVREENKDEAQSGPPAAEKKEK